MNKIHLVIGAVIIIAVVAYFALTGGFASLTGQTTSSMPPAEQRIVTEQHRTIYNNSGPTPVSLPNFTLRVNASNYSISNRSNETMVLRAFRILKKWIGMK